ncbi:MAG: glycosyltransferase family A protein, partial [Puia sp.]
MDVSVIIPCFNSAEFLPDAIRTAEMAIKGFKAEIIIVDDGSTQKSMLDLLNKLEETGKYSIVHRKNGGPAAARNSGVKISKGKYLLFLDSDNKLRPNFISTTLPLMKSDAKNG